MSFDSILTLVSILIAVLALMSRSTRLTLLLNFQFFDKLIIIFAMIVILYLLFLPTFLVFDFTPGFNLHRWRINPSNSIFLVILFGSIYSVLRLKYSSLRISRIPKLRILVDNLLQEGKYVDLITIVEKYYTKLFQILNKSTMYHRFLSKVVPVQENRGILFQTQSTGNRFASFLNKIKTIFKVLPLYQTEQSEARLLVNTTLLHDKFIEYIVQSRSYIFLKLFKVNLHYRIDFCDVLIRKLLHTRNSIIYDELKNSQNVSRHCDYSILEENKFVFYLLDDVSVAEELNIPFPIGDYVINRLNEYKRHPERDPYNSGQSNEFSDSDKWKSDVYVSIHLFNLMASRALHCNNEWHFWINYYFDFIERMIQNHTTNDVFYNENSEWPTCYEYMIYEMISNMRNWLKELEYLPDEYGFYNIEKMDLTYGPHIIPIMAISTIGRSLYAIQQSNTISNKFKEYIFKIIFDTYFDLRGKERLKNYSDLLFKALKLDYAFFSGDNTEYINWVINFVKEKYDKTHIDNNYFWEFCKLYEL